MGYRLIPRHRSDDWYPPIMDPIARLLQRAEQAPSAAERHHSAWFAIEVLLKIAASARVLAWVRTDPSEQERKRLAPLARASVGHWVGLLRDLELPPDHPLRTELSGAALAPAQAWAEDAVAWEVLPRDVRRGAANGVLGALTLGVSWRNEVVGHGAWREEGFYAHFAARVLDTARALAAHPALLGGARLEGGALVGDGWQVGLEPLVLVRRHELFDTAQVGLLNRVRGRRKRAVYLDYVTGETFDGDDDPRLAELIPAAPGLTSGSSRAAPYELLELLGKGGMGEVHLARQVATGRRVAIKLLPEAMSDDAVANERFRREVRALARVEHPAVVSLIAAGTLGKRPYYAMEHIDGLDLAQVRRQVFPEGPRRPGGSALEAALDLPEVSAEATLRRSSEGDNRRASTYETQLARLFCDVAEGLHALHGAGVVHRDVKPDNLLLSRDTRRLVRWARGCLRARGDALRAPHGPALPRRRHRGAGHPPGALRGPAAGAAAGDRRELGPRRRRAQRDGAAARRPLRGCPGAGAGSGPRRPRGGGRSAARPALALATRGGGTARHRRVGGGRIGGAQHAGAACLVRRHRVDRRRSRRPRGGARRPPAGLSAADAGGRHPARRAGQPHGRPAGTAGDAVGLGGLPELREAGHSG